MDTQTCILRWTSCWSDQTIAMAMMQAVSQAPVSKRGVSWRQGLSRASRCLQCRQWRRMSGLQHHHGAVHPHLAQWVGNLHLSAGRSWCSLLQRKTAFSTIHCSVSLLKIAKLPATCLSQRWLRGRPMHPFDSGRSNQISRLRSKHSNPRQNHSPTSLHQAFRLMIFSPAHCSPHASPVKCDRNLSKACQRRPSVAI